MQLVGVYDHSAKKHHAKTETTKITLENVFIQDFKNNSEYFVNKI